MNDLFNEEIKNLKEDLQEFIDDAEKLLGYKVDRVVEDLLKLNTKESISLATDIFETQNDINILETYQEDFIDETFNTLQDEDEDI